MSWTITMILYTTFSSVLRFPFCGFNTITKVWCFKILQCFLLNKIFFYTIINLIFFGFYLKSLFLLSHLCCSVFVRLMSPLSRSLVDLSFVILLLIQSRNSSVVCTSDLSLLYTSSFVLSYKWGWHLLSLEILTVFSSYNSVCKSLYFFLLKIWVFISFILCFIVFLSRVSSRVTLFTFTIFQ